MDGLTRHRGLWLRCCLLLFTEHGAARCPKRSLPTCSGAQLPNKALTKPRHPPGGTQSSREAPAAPRRRRARSPSFSNDERSEARGCAHERPRTGSQARSTRRSPEPSLPLVVVRHCQHVAVPQAGCASALHPSPSLPILTGRRQK